jgi:outer membrane protein assembly factor BamB
MDILGYNLTADTMLWYRNGIAKISSTATPVISGDKVYFYGGSKVHCIDPANGEDIWEFQVGGSNSLEFVGSNILLHDDMLIAKPDSRAMYALDKETGQQIWYNPATMSSPSAMTIESDTVYFTGYYLNGVVVNTGELVVQYESPESRSFFHGVGINPDNGYVYASDGKYLYCLDPKKMK